MDMNSFFPSFEEQVIYDKGGIKLTYVYHLDGANPGFDFNHILYYKIENGSTHKVNCCLKPYRTRMVSNCGESV